MGRLQLTWEPDGLMVIRHGPSSDATRDKKGFYMPTRSRSGLLLVTIAAACLFPCAEAGMAQNAPTAAAMALHAAHHLDEIDYYPPWIALGAKVGTLGPGPEMTVGILESYVNIRGGVNYLPLNFNASAGDVDFEVDLNWFSAPVMVDLHPFGNNFRISGGALYNRNRGNLDARLNAVQKLGDHYYTPSEIGTLSGSVNFKNFGPYLGIGYGNAVGGPDTAFNFVFDIGVVFQGRPEIGLSADGTLSHDPVFIADLEQERAKVQDKADKFEFYPVLNFGISYQF